MRLIFFSLIIFGFASWNELWHSGWPNLRRARGNHASLQLANGGHLKLSQPVPPQLANRLSTPLQFSINNSISASQPPASRLSLHEYIQHLADSVHAEIGVAFRDLETGKEFFFNEKQMMHAASTMKVPVMIEVFRQAEKDNSPGFRLDDSLPIKNEFKSIVDGSPYQLDMSDDSDSSMYRAIGTKLTIRRLVEQMITVSSNLATNILIELAGAENVMATLRELGIRNMQVRRGVEDGKAYNLGLNNQTDAFDMMLALQAIAERRAASPIACDSMLAILTRQKFRDGIPAGLPKEIVVGNKTGSITAIAHDCAIVFPENQVSVKKPNAARKPYVLAVLTRGIQEEKTANRVIAAISRKIYSGLMTSL